MIRICALDFLNRDSFESDVKLADGKVIISAGERVTPEMILMLYFKEIYVDKPLSDIMSGSHESAKSSAPITIVDYAGPIPPNDVEAPIELQKGEEKPKDNTMESSFDLSQNSVSKENISEEEQAAPFEKTPTPAAPDLSMETPLDTSSKENKDVGKVPNAPDIDLEKPLVDNPLEGGVDLGKKYSEEDTDSDNTQNEKTPVAPTLDLGEDIAETPVKEEPEKPKIRILKFDEDVAKEISINAAKLARELSISENIISDIEKAALICDIGLDSFSIDNVREKDFEIKKAKVSYEKALKQNIYSNEVLEIVKCHAKPYVSENFDLNPNIPSGDILHIACMFSRYQYLGMSKEKALMKMLEQGGNEYNVFALHKFLRLMRNG